MHSANVCVWEFGIARVCTISKFWFQMRQVSSLPYSLLFFPDAMSFARDGQWSSFATCCAEWQLNQFTLANYYCSQNGEMVFSRFGMCTIRSILFLNDFLSWSKVSRINELFKCRFLSLSCSHSAQRRRHTHGRAHSRWEEWRINYFLFFFFFFFLSFAST